MAICWRRLFSMKSDLLSFWIGFTRQRMQDQRPCLILNFDIALKMHHQFLASNNKLRQTFAIKHDRLDPDPV